MKNLDKENFELNEKSEKEEKKENREQKNCILIN